MASDIETKVRITAEEHVSGPAKKASESLKNLKDKKVKLEAEDGVSPVVDNIKGSMEGLGESVAGSLLGVFTGGALLEGVKAVASAIGEIVNKMIELGTQTQKQISRLDAMKNLTGDARAAYQQFNDVGRETNYSLQAVQEWGVQLVNMGYSAKNAADMIRLCSDAAAGLGRGEAEAQQIIETLSRMQATGEATSRQIVALQMDGMDLDKAFSSINMSAEEAMKAMDEGSLDAQAAIQALTAYMHEFDGSMAESKNNITDTWGDVVANIETACGEIGESIFDAFNQSEIVQDLIDFTQELVDFVRSDGCGAFEDLQAVAEVALEIIRVALKAIYAMIKLIIVAAAQMYSAFRRIGARIANALAPILQPLSKIWNYIKSILSSLGQQFSEYVGEDWNKFYSGWSEGGDTVVDDENHFRNVKRAQKQEKTKAKGARAGGGGRKNTLADRIAQKIQEEYKKALEKVQEMATDIAAKIASTNETKEQESLRKLEAERVKYYNKIAEYRRKMEAAQTEEEKAGNEAKLKALEEQWKVYEAARKKEIARQADTTGYELEMQHIQNLSDMHAVSAERRMELENNVLAVRRQQLETLYNDTTINAERRAEIEKQLADVITKVHQNAAYNVREGWRMGLYEIANQQTNFKDLTVSMFNAFETGLTNIVTGTQSAKEVFKNFFRDIIKQLTQILIRSLITQAIMRAIGVKTGPVSVGSIGSGGVFSGLDFSGGSLYEAGAGISVSGFARGGNVSAGQVAVVGEQGPEVVRFGSPGRVYSNSDSRALLWQQEPPVVNIEIVNNTDTQMKARQENSFDGVKQLKRVIIETVNSGLYTNEGGLRDNVAGVRGY